MDLLTRPLLAISLVLLSGCAVDGVGGSEPSESFWGAAKDRDAGFYVAGYYKNGAGKRVAAYWTREGQVSLTDGATHAWARGIAVNAEGSIHVSGYYEKPATSVAIASVWKDGVRTDLTDGINAGYAYELTLDSSGNVYVAGATKMAGKLVAVYWKNGVKTELSDGSVDSYARSLAITASGSVIASGYEYDGSLSTPVLWIDGTRQALGTAGLKASAEHVLVLPSGQWFAPGVWTDSGGVSFAASWTASGQTLVDPQAPKSAASAAAVDKQGNVYIAGSYAVSAAIGTPSIACYWKNGEKMPLTAGLANAEARAMAIDQRGIPYFAGITQGPSLRWIVSVWEGTQPLLLTDGQTDAEAYSIAIQ